MMIYVIIDNKKYTKAQVVKELKAEKYSHRFFIPDGQDVAIKEKAMRLCNEVWVFGECFHMHDYDTANEMRKDLWCMG